MANIVTRETVGPQCTVNGVPLSYAQMDNDLIALNNDIITLQGYYTTGVTKVLNGGTGVTTKTGTGSVVLNNSPTLVAPVLGTPTSGNFSTGTFTWPTFNQNTSGSAATLSATLTADKGGTGVTTSTGSGSVVLNNSPTLVTPALGTPSSGVVTNLSGTASININGTVGGTTPTTGKFTTVNVSSNNDTANGGGQIYLSGVDGNRIDFGAVGTGIPSYTTRSIGTKLCLYPTVSPSRVDFAIGIGANILWNSVPDNLSSFRWYSGATEVLALDETGLISSGIVFGKLTAANTLQFAAIQGASTTWYAAGIRNDGNSAALKSSIVSTTELGARSAALSAFTALSWNLSTGAVAINTTPSGATTIDGTICNITTDLKVIGKVGFNNVTPVAKAAAPTAPTANAPAGGTGTAAGGWDTSAHRDTAIAAINNLMTRVAYLENVLSNLGLTA